MHGLDDHHHLQSIDFDIATTAGWPSKSSQSTISGFLAFVLLPYLNTMLLDQTKSDMVHYRILSCGCVPFLVSFHSSRVPVHFPGNPENISQPQSHVSNQ
jgi:hypothetical protein